MNKKGKFLAGALVGLGLGFLFAPKKGSETREELKVKLNDLAKKAKEVEFSELKEEFEAKIFELKMNLEDLDKEKALKIAKKKAKDVQRLAEELFDYAVEKGTPVVEKTAASVKEMAIKVTKEVLEKLEKEEKSE